MFKKFLTIFTILFLVASCSSDDSNSDDEDTQVVDTGDDDDSGSDDSSGSDDGSDDGGDNANVDCEGERVCEITSAMVTFRNSLSDDLLSQADNELEDERFYLWHNTPGDRDGITIGDLSDTQEQSFQDVLALFLSEGGYQKVYEVTELAESVLAESNSNVYGTENYSIDLFGDPSVDDSWGFQLDGHHLAINFLVHEDYISIVPAFIGADPAVDSFNNEDYDVFQDERELAISLYQGLTDNESSEAVTVGSSDHSLEVGPANSAGDVDPYRGDYDYSGFETGLRYADMSDDSKAALETLMKEYVYNLTDEHADLWWEDIEANIDNTYFKWISEDTDLTSTSAFYYRIYNPYVWIEFNAEVALGGNAPDYNHIHTITRIPTYPTTTENGGDYGPFAQMMNDGVKTLYEHYAKADHHKADDMLFDYRVTVKAPHSHEHGHSHDH